MDGPEIEYYLVFYKKEKAFSDLAEIFDDLRW